MSSKNPVLKNITDYLIEEASAEEEELLGMSGDQEEGQLGGDGDSSIERDPILIKVRSFDFFFKWKLRKINTNYLKLVM